MHDRPTAIIRQGNNGGLIAARFPKTPSEMHEALLGRGDWTKSDSGIWLCDDSSTQLVDSSANANHLVSIGAAPTYRDTGKLPDYKDRVVNFGNSGYSNCCFTVSDVNRFELTGTKHMIIVAVQKQNAVSVSPYVYCGGKINTGGTGKYWGWYSNTSGHWGIVWNNTVTSGNSLITVDHVDGNYHLMLILVERGYGTQAMTELGQSALNITDLGSCDNPTTGLALGRYSHDYVIPTVAMSTAFLGVLQSDDASCVGMVSNISKIHYNFRKWTGLLP